MQLCGQDIYLFLVFNIIRERERKRMMNEYISGRIGLKSIIMLNNLFSNPLTKCIHTQHICILEITIKSILINSYEL